MKYQWYTILYYHNPTLIHFDKCMPKKVLNKLSLQLAVNNEVFEKRI